MQGYNWKTGLPKDSSPATALPVALEKFEDETACARRIKGFDTQGELCYYYHSYAINRERFDEEG